MFKFWFVAALVVLVLFAGKSQADGHFETRKVCVNGVCQMQMVWVEHAPQAAKPTPTKPVQPSPDPVAAAPCPTGACATGSVFHRERHVIVHGEHAVRAVTGRFIAFVKSHPVRTGLRRLFCH